MTLLFFDFDGTLYIDGAISPACRTALLRAKEQGAVIILNTGRSYGYLPRGVRGDDLFDGMICGSAYLRYKGEVLENLTLPRATLQSACLWGRKHGRQVVFEGVDESYSVNGTLEDAEIFFTDAPLPQITKVTMWCDPAEVADADFPGLRVVRFKDYAEGIHPGRSKSSGMKTLSDILGVDRAHTVAFGDSENDEEMLRFAGTGVCMASAPAYFDGFCAYRCKERDGVPEALRILFPEKAQ